MAPDSLDSATKQDWTTDIIMFLLWLCHVSPLAELHPCIHNQRTPNFAVYNHTYIYIYICIDIYIYLYICVCVCVCASGPWRSWSQAQPRGRRQGAEPLNIYQISNYTTHTIVLHDRGILVPLDAPGASSSRKVPEALCTTKATPRIGSWCNSESYPVHPRLLIAAPHGYSVYCGIRWSFVSFVMLWYLGVLG